MVGPSDSFTHEICKLSNASRNAIRGLQNMDVPPAYTAKPVVEDENSDDDSNAESWTGLPLTIRVNASISIEGTGNQVALPPHPVARPFRVTGDEIRAAQGSAQDYLGFLAGAQESATQTLNRDRATQISDAVMQALTTSGMFTGTVRPQRQLDIHVDSSIKVKGERNILTTNVPIRRTMSENIPGETPSPLRTLQGQSSGPNHTESGSIASSAGQAPILVDMKVATQETSREGGVSETISTKRKSILDPEDGDGKEDEGGEKRAKT